MFILIFLVIVLIVVTGYNEITNMPRSKGRPRRQVMHLVEYRDTRDSGFAG